MGKKQILPLTKAVTAEERLEEIINKKLVKAYYTALTGFEIKNSECRAYPDGFEAFLKDKWYNAKGFLYLNSRHSAVFYDIEKEKEYE